jgi:segregation and condensation protein A
VAINPFFQEQDAFEDARLAPGEDGPGLVIDLDGFEGPLDLLLDLARRERLDLRAISILDLAEQYLAFIGAARRLRLELAGDYLVMAAWLTYLKSRLLLPRIAHPDEPETEALVQDLAARLQRLETFRKAGEWLAGRLADARGSLPRGRGEAVVIAQHKAWAVSFTELVAAYAERRTQTVKAHYTIMPRRTLSIPEARDLLERLIGPVAEWCPLEALVAAIRPEEAERRSAKASTFVAALELVRDGSLDLKQEEAFATIYLRRSAQAAQI